MYWLDPDYLMKLFFLLAGKVVGDHWWNR